MRFRWVVKSKRIRPTVVAKCSCVMESHWSQGHVKMSQQLLEMAASTRIRRTLEMKSFMMVANPSACVSAMETSLVNQGSYLFISLYILNTCGDYSFVSLNFN